MKKSPSPSLTEFARTTYHFRRLCKVCELPQAAEINAARKNLGTRLGPKVVRDWLISERAENIPSIPTLQKHFSEKHHEAETR